MSPLNLVLTFAGLFVVGVLSLGHLLNLPVPCGERHGCAEVAASPASRLFGIPISLFGFALYAALAVLASRNALRSIDLAAAAALSGVGTAISAWLLVYAERVLHAQCLWCMASGGIMAACFLMSLTRLAHARTRTLAGPPPPLVYALIGATAIALGVQTGLMIRTANRPPLSPAVLATVKLAELTRGIKSRGPEDAVLTIVEFADFACPACRAQHPALLDYQRRNPEAVRLVFRHQPLYGIRGHEKSPAAAALAEIAAERGRFWEFAGRLYESKAPLDDELLERVTGEFGWSKAGLQKRLADVNDPARARFDADVALANRLGVKTTPAFVIILKGQPPISAGPASMRRILNSPPVVEALLKKNRPHEAPR